MKGATILPIFLLALHQTNYSEYLTRINRPIRELLNTIKFSDVQFLIYNPSKSKSEILDQIYKTVSETLPTSSIDLNDSIPVDLLFINLRPETLLLFAYFSKNCPDLQQSEDIADTIIHNYTRPRVLLTTIIEEENCNFLSIFERMWKNLFANVMILEIPQFNGNQTAMMIHQYNPFRRIYDRQSYTSSVEWFPEKLKNLYGYPMRVFFLNKAGNMEVKKDSRGRLKAEGPDANVLYVLAQTLNFTPDTYKLSDDVDNGIIAPMKADNIDILPVALPFCTYTTFTQVWHTLPVSMENWCPVVPIVYKSETYIISGIISLAINIGVVLVFWGISVTLKLDQRSWNPLKIFGLLIDSSVTMTPRKPIERFMILGLIFISSIHTSNLFADLTTNNLRGKSMVEYKNFKELNDSGLTPVMIQIMHHLTYVGDDEYFAALKNKSLLTPNINTCGDYLAKHRNITCFIERKTALMVIGKYLRRGENVMTISEDLCYARPPVGYVVKKNLPYTDRINEIIIRLYVTGIHDKWNADYIRKFTPRKTHLINTEEKRESTLMLNLIRIGGCGCLLSFLVFCAEIMVSRNGNKKKK